MNKIIFIMYTNKISIIKEFCPVKPCKSRTIFMEKLDSDAKKSEKQKN